MNLTKCISIEILEYNKKVDSRDIDVLVLVALYSNL